MRDRWLRRLTGPRAVRSTASRARDETGTELVIAWIDAAARGLANPAPGPSVAAASRVCDGLFTVAAITAVLHEKVAAQHEYRTINLHCVSAAVEFMKVLGEDTLRTHRIGAVRPVGWEQMTPAMNASAITARLIHLGEALQLALCAVTIDPTLTPEVREVADAYGLPAATVIVKACRTLLTDPHTP